MNDEEKTIVDLAKTFITEVKSDLNDKIKDVDKRANERITTVEQRDWRLVFLLALNALLIAVDIVVQIVIK